MAASGRREKRQKVVLGWQACAKHPVALRIIHRRLAGESLDSEENEFLQTKRKVVRHAIVVLKSALTVTRVGPEFQVVASRSGISVPPSLRAAMQEMLAAGISAHVRSPVAAVVTSGWTREQSAEFYISRAWRELRYRAILLSKGKCEACGRGKSHGVVLHVDHVRPISRFPALRLTLENLQVLCEDCNMGKGAWDQTDWRGPRLAVDNEAVQQRSGDAA